MNTLKNWKTFLQHIRETYTTIDVPQLAQAGFELSYNVGTLIRVSGNEVLNNTEVTDLRVQSISNILKGIAVTELYYRLPPSRYAGSLLLEDFDVDALNLLEVASDLHSVMSDLLTALTEGDVDAVQYALNILWSILLSVAGLYDVDLLSCLKSTPNNADPITSAPKKAAENTNTKAVKPSVLHYERSKALIDTKGAKELAVDVLFDKRRKKPYKGLSYTFEGKSHKFWGSNVIVDFFKLSNKIKENHGGENYLINYTPAFRDYLNNQKGAYIMGYLSGGEIITAEKVFLMEQDPDTDATKITRMKANRLPIILTPELKTFEQFLDYINEHQVRD